MIACMIKTAPSSVKKACMTYKSSLMPVNVKDKTLSRHRVYCNTIIMVKIVISEKL